MTKYNIEERRLRRLEKRIAHLTALMKLMTVMGGRFEGRTQTRARELFLQEYARLWKMQNPDGDPEDMARKPGAGN